MAQRERLRHAYRQIQGTNPSKTPFVIDFGGSKVMVKYDTFPTMTATRCKCYSYWSTELKRRFKKEELMRAQGADPKMLKTEMISDAAMGQIVGNAIAVPMFRRILDNIMTGLR